MVAGAPGNPCSTNVPILFIPRKDSLQSHPNEDEAYQDQRANWQAIELWGNNLPPVPSPATAGVVATGIIIPGFHVLSTGGTPQPIPYDVEMWGTEPCGTVRVLILGATQRAYMPATKQKGVVRCDAGVTFGPITGAAANGYIQFSLHILSSGGPSYDKVIAEQTIPVPVGMTFPVSMQVSATVIQAANEASFFATIFQTTGGNITVQNDNRTFIASSMIAPNAIPLNGYL